MEELVIYPLVYLHILILEINVAEQMKILFGQENRKSRFCDHEVNYRINWQETADIFHFFNL